MENKVFTYLYNVYKVTLLGTYSILSSFYLAASFEVKEDFYAYRSGVYKYANAVSGDSPEQRETGWHSIRIIGWGTDYTDPRRPTDYWVSCKRLRV